MPPETHDSSLTNEAEIDPPGEGDCGERLWVTAVEQCLGIAEGEQHRQRWPAGAPRSSAVACQRLL